MRRCFILFVVCFSWAAFGSGLVARADDKAALFASMSKGMALQDQADYNGALAEFEDALRRAPKILPPDSILLPRIMNTLGILHREMSNHAQAEAILLRALKLQETTLPSDSQEIGASTLNLAMVYTDLGQYAKAQALLERSYNIQLPHFGENHPNISRCYNNFAHLHYCQEHYAESAALYERSLRIELQHYGPEHLKVASTLNNLANNYGHLGQFEKAEEYYLRSLKITKANLPADHPTVGTRLLNLGRHYVVLGQHAKAEPYYRESIKILEAKLGPNHLDTALGLNSLAAFYNDKQEFTEAERLYRRILTIQEAQLDEHHPDLANTLNNLANTMLNLKQPRPALELYQRSLRIRERAFGPDHPTVAASHHNLGSLYRTLGQIGLAADSVDRGRRIARRHVMKTLPLLSDLDQLRFLMNVDKIPFFKALDLGRLYPGQSALTEQSLGWLLNGKAVAQEALAERTLLLRDMTDPALADKARTLLALRGELASLAHVQPAADQAENHRRKVAALTEREQNLAQELHQAAGRTTRYSTWFEPADLRDAIPKDAVLVDIAQFHPSKEQPMENIYWEPQRYVAWITPPAGSGQVQIVDLGPAEIIDAAIEQARKSLASAGQENSQLRREGETAAVVQATKDLQAVSNLVWKPLAGKVGAAQQLILSPDGALWLLPWAALPVAEDKCLLEEYALRFVISGRDVVRQNAAPQNPRKLLTTQPAIFSDPDFDLSAPATRAALQAVLPDLKFDANATRGLANRSSLPRAARLPFTAIEAKAAAPSIEQFAGAPAVNYTATYALESIAKRITRPKLLHFATHGFFLADQKSMPANSQLAVSSADSLPLANQRTEHPLLRCGLLLTGCNTPQAAGGDDGILTGMEIVGLDLRGTELVVLSACETGIGTVLNGEGVAGLRQAFQLAGAQSVVSTLWQVPDRDSALIMQDFFTNLAAGQTKADALRNAQLKRIAARREKYGAAHPFFWAAWTMTGE